jgi:TonB-dependent SusC/RagA subfamily outer membrane receptor
VLIACAFPFLSLAQTVKYASTKEKVYVQTNHVFFKPGETVYFKVYVVNAKDQKPTAISNVVYVEFINPSGNVLQKQNCKVENGYAVGSFDFNETAVGGLYKIKAYTSWMRNENDSVFFVKEITLQKVIAPRILMKLDFPEKGYGAGSEVSANFSMRNLNDQSIRNYQGKFTVLIGGEKVQSDNFKTDHEGKTKIKFFLPKELKTNDGLLNVTVNYDSYTEAISRSIPIVLNKIDLQFMPEGGTFVEGISTNIAFKALNENGKAADIKGEVWNSKGNKVTSFESYHFGMGIFAFTPQKGEKYKVKIISPANISQQFELPSATETGVVMNFSKLNNKIIVKLISTDQRQVNLDGQTKGMSFYAKNILLQKGENHIEIDESFFPAGIAQFTLYAADLPIAERLMFLNENKYLQVTITADKKKYLPREKVKLTLKTLDENNRPVPSNFSLTVIDDKLWSFADDKQDHILSWLLMSSELHGKVEEPQFYFKKDEPKAVPALDLVMLTHGYRYFDYIEYVKKEGQLKFTPDQDNILSGIVVDGKGHPVKASILLVSTTATGKGLQIKTDEDGVFFFSHLQPNTKYYLIGQSLNKKEKVSIQISQNGIGYNPLKNGFYKQRVFAVNDFAIGQKNAEAKIPMDKAELEKQMQINNKPLHLEEVVVIGYGAQKRKDVTGAVAVINAKELVGINNLGFALQGKVPGVEVVNNANPAADPKINIRGMRSLPGINQPLFVVNGVVVEQPNLNAFNPNDIEQIYVLKDAAATAIYGAKASNGVIIIETKKYRTEKIRFNFNNSYYYISQLINISGPVYSVAKRFYVPKYNSPEVEKRTDFRETIYWNPVIQTDKNGKAEVEFYNSDASTTFRAIAEGIGYNGKLGRAETTYAAQNAMSADAKIPPYLTVGDQALIPLVIKNNYAEDLNISIEVSAANKFKIGNYSNAVSVKPDSSRQITIPIEAIAEVKGSVHFIIKNQFGKQTLTLPIAVADKGFPVIETFSGNRSQQHNFTINKMISGTVKANLKLFKNLEGQLLDGIESMLREPYGCFEQTSSTTYPNIYVLKYLRESGKSNPEIEKKTLGYISNGYNRLIGYETEQNGFEWFGHTPPHEALTAYGLLEFTDMKEFIKIDEQMLNRTKDFLMSRRDGQGHFKLAADGLDQFRTVPDKIANVYIVYALTQAGIGKEIQLEYQTAVKKALESNDGYQMAMMALAASNMKNKNDFEQLMVALNKLYQKMNLSSETSVVNSRDASLRVETMSLYALALMREPSPDIASIANLISKILSEKAYYGYGATQATVLALQAIVEYSKLTSKVTDDIQVDFTMNSKKVNESKNIEGELHEGNNLFIVQYGQQNRTIPYSLEISYNTLTPPNDEKAELQLITHLKTNQANVGETVRMEIEVTNQRSILQPMAIAKIGIPAGLSAQPWQLKEIMEKNQVAYYEIFDNYLVLYWMGFRANETKEINLDLKAEIAGTYKGKASNTYLYYTPEYKNWNDGLEIEIRQ